MKFKKIVSYLLIVSMIILLNSCSKEQFKTDENKTITMNPPLNTETDMETNKAVDYNADSLNTDRLVNSNEQQIASAHILLDENSLNVINKIKEIEAILINYYEDADSETINQATLAFLRKDNYGYNNDGLSKFVWSSYAGNLKNEVDFDININIEITNRIETIVENLSTFTDPISGEILDFYHLIVVVDLLATEYSDVEYEDLYLDSLLSWGGDLETLMTDAVNYSIKYNVSDSEKIKQFTINALGSNEYSFPIDDFIADIDGFNISNMLNNEDILLSDAIYNYYSMNYSATRIDRFIDFYGSKEKLRVIINVVSFRIKELKYSNSQEYLDFFEDFSTIQSMVSTLGNNGKVPINDQIRTNVTEGFFDVVTNENNILYQKLNIGN